MELVLVEAATAWCSLHKSKNLDAYKAIVAKLLTEGVSSLVEAKSSRHKHTTMHESRTYMG